MSLESKSKKELVEIIEELRAKIKSGEVTVNPEIDESSLDKLAVSIERNGTVYSVIKLKYNSETRLAKVVDKQDYPKQPHMAAYNARRLLDEEILLKIQRGEK